MILFSEYLNLNLNSNTYYHGCNIKANALSIEQNGIKGNKKDADKYIQNLDFTPLENGIYLTKNLGNAMRYAMMILPNKTYQESIAIEPNGYIFEININESNDIVPDEDEIGFFAIKIIQTKKPTSLYNKLINMLDPNTINDVLNDTEGRFDLSAKVGKTLVNSSVLSKDIVQYLINNKYTNIVNINQTLHPTKEYIVKKPQNQFFKDYSQYEKYMKNNIIQTKTSFA